MDYLPRTIEPVLKAASGLFKVVMLSGMRQVGKSTLLKHLAEPERRYLSLDTGRVRQSAAAAPDDFFRQNEPPLLLDEVQRAPSLFLPLKDAVDSNDAKGQVWLSGSQRLQLMQGAADALPGRLISFDLLPLSIYEREGKGLLQKPFLPSAKPPRVLRAKTEEETWRLIFQGAWPDVIGLGPQARNWWFQALIDSYVSRDVAALMGVQKQLEFQAFLKALADRTGQELRLQSLAVDSGVAVDTVKKWLSIAEASGVIYLLRPYFANVGKQLVKSPRVYFADTGLAAYLLDIQTPEELSRSGRRGAFFETFAFTEILKGWVHNGEKADFYFYRDSKGMEIDLLIHAGGKLYPVEMKAKSSPDAKDAKWIEAFRKMDSRCGRGAVVSLAEEPYAVAPGVSAMSIWDI